jgi:hypothetical protein
MLELLGEIRDRRVCASELLQNAASGDVRQRGERGNALIGRMQGEAERRNVATMSSFCTV